MKRTLIVMSTVAALAFQVHAANFYSTGTIWPDSNGSWNLLRDGTDTTVWTNGQVIGESTNVMYVQKGHTMGITDNGTDLTFEAGMVLETNAVWRVRASGGGINYAYGATYNADIVVDGTNVIVRNGIESSVTNAAVISGTGKFQLGSETVMFREAFSSAAGTVEWNIGIVGDGTIDFAWGNAGMVWDMGGLAEGTFTGRLRMGRMSCTAVLPAGDGCLNATLDIADNASRTGKLWLRDDFSVAELEIELLAITNGVYTYSNLLSYGTANGLNFADNLIDDGGRIFVGMSSEPYPTYVDWAADQGLTGANNAYGDNPDSDDLDNLSEYAMGGNPLDPNDPAGVVPTYEAVGGGANFQYVYNRRTDAVQRNLAYELINTDNLVGGLWNNDSVEVGVSAPFTDALGDEFVAVTNHFSTAGDPEQFEWLDITISE